MFKHHIQLLSFQFKSFTILIFHVNRLEEMSDSEKITLQYAQMKQPQIRIKKKMFVSKNVMQFGLINIIITFLAKLCTFFV